MTPQESLDNALRDLKELDDSKEIRGYTRIVVETDEDEPEIIADITKELIMPADGYRVRLTPEYD